MNYTPSLRDIMELGMAIADIMRPQSKYEEGYQIYLSGIVELDRHLELGITNKDKEKFLKTMDVESSVKHVLRRLHQAMPQAGLSE